MSQNPSLIFELDTDGIIANCSANDRDCVLQYTTLKYTDAAGSTTTKTGMEVRTFDIPLFDGNTIDMSIQAQSGNTATINFRVRIDATGALPFSIGGRNARHWFTLVSGDPTGTEFSAKADCYTGPVPFPSLFFATIDNGGTTTDIEIDPRLQIAQPPGNYTVK